MKPVIIAEKPSQAKAYAEAFTVKERSKSYIEIEANDIFSQGAYITWGIGHLVELKMPNEFNSPINAWNIENLPFLKADEFKVSEDKKVQFNAVKKLCNQADLIVNACDCDREGSNIFYLILEHANIRNKQIKRLWINSLEKDEVIKGFKNLEDTDKDRMMFLEAKSRMVSDYLIGMNLSPLYTLKLRERGINNETFSVGRVQTPTLFLIYQRYLEISNFKPQKFFEVHAIFEKDAIQYPGKMKIKELDEPVETQRIFDEISSVKEGHVTHISKERKAQESPELFSLSTLQSKANKLFKYSPKKTLQIVQSLYEKKLLTYPRTDTHHITENEFNYLNQNLEDYLSLFDLKIDTPNREPRKRFVDSKKVQEHYAIVLTKSVNKESISKLSDEEKNIFKTVYDVTIAMFMSRYEYEVTEVVTAIGQHEFHSRGKADVALGWKSLMKDDEEKEDKLPLLQEGELVRATPSLYEGITKPPNPYTEGQLINVMKTCGKYMDDSEDTKILKDVEGIGTEATRADVIEKLKQQNYIKVEKNKINISSKGIILCKAVSGTLLSSPQMTAKWEQALKEISERKRTPESFIANIEKYLTHQVNNIEVELRRNDIAADIHNHQEEHTVGTCPKCKKGKVIQKKLKNKSDIYACSSSDCDFVIFTSIGGKRLTQKHVKDLIEKGKTEKIKGFKSKKGKTFETDLILDENMKVSYNFK